MNFKQSLVLLLFITLCNTLFGQFLISSEFRTRFEYRDGYKKIASINDNSASSISQRTRLFFNYENENLKLVFAPQDVRIWGDEQLSSSTGVYGDDYSLSLFEAYSDIKIIDSLWIKVGRQQLVYDNQRLLAARNWNQNGLAYDAVFLKYNYNKWNIHLAGSWNSLSAKNNKYLAERIKSLNFLWINKKIDKKTNFSIMHIASGTTETDSTERLFFTQTSGIYFETQTGILKFSGDCFYQYGKNNQQQNVNALLVDFETALKLNKITPSVGISYMSGDNNLQNNSDKMFSNLYGARHRFFGHIDYFSNTQNSTNYGGLVDYFGKINIKLSKKLELNEVAHYFFLSETNFNTPNEKNLGFENDFQLKYKFNYWGEFRCEYCFLLPTNSLKTIQNVQNDKFSQFFYVQLCVNPSILLTK